MERFWQSIKIIRKNNYYIIINYSLLCIIICYCFFIIARKKRGIYSDEIQYQSNRGLFDPLKRFLTLRQPSSAAPARGVDSKENLLDERAGTCMGFESEDAASDLHC